MKNIFLTLITAIILLPFACNPKDEIAPENPCGNYVPPSADFIFEESMGEVVNNEYIFYSNPFISKDILKTPSRFQFRSQFEDTNTYKHTWYIGKEILHKYKEWRDFTQVQPETYITISHVIKWKPNKFCNPKETGYDSMGFTFKITDKLKELGTFGKYRMVYDTVGAPTIQDSVEVELYICRTNYKDSITQNPLYSDLYSEFRIKGLLTYGWIFPSDDLTIVPSNSNAISRSYDFISNSYARFSACCHLYNLKIEMDKNRKTFIEYYTNDPKIIRDNKKFKLKGRKLSN